MIRPRSITADGRLRAKRRAAALVESAIVLSVFLTLILGMLDYGLVVLNRNNLETAACRLARAAIVHGERSEAAFVPWGPDSIDGSAGEGNDAAQAVAPFLVIMAASDVRFRLEWPDGSNAVGQRVCATLTYDHQPMFAGFFGTSTWKLRAVSIMRIQH